MRFVCMTVLLLVALLGLTFAEEEVEMPSMEPRIEDMDSLIIVGVGYQGDDIFERIMTLWMELIQRKGEFENLASQVEAFGVSLMPENAEKQTDFRYIAGYEVTKTSKIPEGMEIVTIPAGKYAIFTHKGSLENLQATYAYILGVWPQKTTEYSLRHAPQLERYGLKFNAMSEQSEIEILVPIDKVETK